jgi:hypothetical protein
VEGSHLRTWLAGIAEKEKPMRTILIALLMTLATQVGAFDDNIKSFPHRLEGLWILEEDELGALTGVIVPQYRAVKIKGDNIFIGIYFGTGVIGWQRALEGIKLDNLKGQWSPLRFDNNFHEINRGKIVGQNVLGDILVEMVEEKSSVLKNNRNLEVSFDDGFLSSNRLSISASDLGLTINYKAGSRAFKRMGERRYRMIIQLGLFTERNIAKLNEDFDKFLVASRSPLDRTFPVIGFRTCRPITPDILQSLVDFNYALRWLMAWKLQDLQRFIEAYSGLNDDLNFDSFGRFLDFNDPKIRKRVIQASYSQNFDVGGVLEFLRFDPDGEKFVDAFLSDNGVPKAVTDLGQIFISQLAVEDKDEALSQIISALVPSSTDSEKILEKELWNKFGVTHEIGNVRSPSETWQDLVEFTENGGYRPDC